MKTKTKLSAVLLIALLQAISLQAHDHYSCVFDEAGSAFLQDGSPDGEVEIDNANILYKDLINSQSDKDKGNCVQLIQLILFKNNEASNRDIIFIVSDSVYDVIESNPKKYIFILNMFDINHSIVISDLEYKELTFLLTQMKYEVKDTSRVLEFLYVNENCKTFFHYIDLNTYKTQFEDILNKALIKKNRNELNYFLN